MNFLNGFLYILYYFIWRVLEVTNVRLFFMVWGPLNLWYCLEWWTSWDSSSIRSIIEVADYRKAVIFIPDTASVFVNQWTLTNNSVNYNGNMSEPPGRTQHENAPRTEVCNLPVATVRTAWLMSLKYCSDINMIKVVLLKMCVNGTFVNILE